ncbi:cell division protein SepF [Corynebacterium alimapuense]|uniref:Cell division protein SepF n=1 Tax=Corynebacterium alimapuense TaxID=1576874 RepID=A0A3M8K8C9_9CORY|nr:cell division protein SepF [Corynebacterium alimapuense]RNE49483.1 cell division protein SepF [Corynebacterium alimapuense]
MSTFKNLKDFFGLAPVDLEHEDAYYEDEPRYSSQGSSAYAPAPAPVAAAASRDYGYKYDSYERPSRDFSAAAPQREEPAFAPTIVAVEVATYSEAAEIGGPFRDGDAVVFDMTRMDNGENKRIVDFAAGLCYALRGRMVNLTKNLDTSRTVFAIVPDSAEISQLELERAAGLR